LLARRCPFAERNRAERCLERSEPAARLVAGLREFAAEVQQVIDGVERPHRAVDARIPEQRLRGQQADAVEIGRRPRQAVASREFSTDVDGVIVNAQRLHTAAGESMLPAFEMSTGARVDGCEVLHAHDRVVADTVETAAGEYDARGNGE